MIEDKQQYDFFTDQITRKGVATYDAFKLFLQMFSAIVGGSIWLRLQIDGEAPLSYEYLSDALVVLLALVGVVLVIDNARSWWRYRVRLVEIVGDSAHRVPPPKWDSVIAQFLMSVAMIAVTVMFVAFNPFKVGSEPFNEAGAEPAAQASQTGTYEISVRRISSATIAAP